MSLLEPPSPKQSEIIKQELGEGAEELERGVKDLRTMCSASPHMPEPDTLDTRFLELFVRGCRMDMDRARGKLEEFFLARTRYRDLFEYRTLNEPPLSEVCKFMDIVPLPKVTDEGLRVTIFRVRPDYPDNSADITATVRAILLVSDARMHDETRIAGDVFIWELSEMRSSLTTRVAMAVTAVRRGINLAQAAYPQRLKRIHVVGAPSMLASSLQLMRSCVNEKIRKRYYIHPTLADLLEYIPARVLPSEWGGEEESIDSLARKWRQRIDEVRDFLQNLNDLADIPAPIYEDNELFGIKGAFKRLEID